MSKFKRSFDSRLVGVWKSGRRRTFRNYKPNPGLSPIKFRRFQSIFGKLIIKWGRGSYVTDFNGDRVREPYAVIASDDQSVVVQTLDKLSGKLRLQYIRFEGHYYWTTTGSGLCEYFQRIR
jgi:hypothetical protein